jgi:hypothetical protein
MQLVSLDLKLALKVRPKAALQLSPGGKTSLLLGLTVLDGVIDPRTDTDNENAYVAK